MRLKLESAEFRLGKIIKTTVRAVKSVIVHAWEPAMLIKLLVYAALGAVMMFGFNTGIALTLAGLFGVYLATGGWRFMRIVLLTGPRDVIGLKVLVTLTLRVKNNLRRNRTVPKLFDENVQKYPSKPFILFQDRSWTFSEAQKYSNQVANFLYEAGYRQGDFIALFSENCMEYIPIWLGISRIGVVAALINFNLRDISLSHCIQVANAKAVIVAGNLIDAMKEIRSSLPPSMFFYILNGKESTDFPAHNFDLGVGRSSSYNPPPPATEVRCSDRLFFIYTSGTTGLPKAAVVSHTRFCCTGYGIQLSYKITPEDVDYISLPLYHTAGSIVGAAQGVIGGSTLAHRSKLSASQFWTDLCQVQGNCGPIHR